MNRVVKGSYGGIAGSGKPDKKFWRESSAERA